jgi:hypothetical protein
MVDCTRCRSGSLRAELTRYEGGLRDLYTECPSQLVSVARFVVRDSWSEIRGREIRGQTGRVLYGNEKPYMAV